MKIKKLTLGPIIGETTTSRVRIWGRGDTVMIDGAPRRCFGAVRVRKVRQANWGNAVVFKMNPNFDMTGVGIVERLAANVRYEYEIGAFHSEAELGAIDLRSADWDDAYRGEFRTASNQDRASREIVFGSCRYLLRTFFGSFFDNRGDKTFRSIGRQLDGGDEVHQLLMVGDQIYADDLNSFRPDSSIEKFYARYRDAFGQEHLRGLMARVPTYMTLDDHEIEDNWPEYATARDHRSLLPVAMHAYQAYQLSHSPCIPVRSGRLVSPPNHYWYKYRDGCCDFFVADCRTERSVDAPRAIMSGGQMRAMKRWLRDGSGRVKVVVSSVPFFPDSRKGESLDKWGGFPDQRKELLELIEGDRIKKVVFLSGDIHASLSAQLVSSSGLKITSIVSSAFFWPYPHPSRDSYQTRGKIDGGRAGDFRLENASRVIADDNFTRLSVSTSRVRVQVFRRKGARASDKTYEF